MAKITIFGLAGTGTSTVGKLLAEKLGYEFKPAGGMFRDKAKELGLTLQEFGSVCDKDHSYDIELDRQIEKYGKENDNFIFESRLPWYFIPDSFKVKIICDDDVRLKRVAVRDGISFEEAKEKNAIREAGEKKRYKEIYGINELGPDSAFDIIVDSTFKLPEEIVEDIVKGAGLS